MKNWKFKIREFGLMVTTDREVIVRAKTEASALKRVLEMQGNRDWDITPMGLV